MAREEEQVSGSNALHSDSANKTEKHLVAQKILARNHLYFNYLISALSASSSLINNIRSRVDRFAPRFLANALPASASSRSTRKLISVLGDASSGMPQIYCFPLGGKDKTFLLDTKRLLCIDLSLHL